MPRQIVYILGAGASKHAGLPLLNNFFRHAYDIREQNQFGQPAPAGYATALQEVDDFRKSLKTSKPSVDVHNMEQVYAEALLTKSASLLNALDKVIEGVLDLGGCRVHYYDRRYNPDSVYSRFVDRYCSDDQNVSLITFNWDCLLDYSLSFYMKGPAYCFDQRPTHGKIKLVKIHGSLNWGQCRSCGYAPHIVNPNEKTGRRPGVERQEDVELDLRLATEILHREKCPKCTTGKLAPIIIPPVYEKDFADFMSAPLAQAKSVLEEAEDLFFIGYSFPESDQYFVKFMREALAGNIRLKQVNVINPDPEGVLQRRYEVNLDIAKHHLQINVRRITFEDFVSA